MTSSFLESVAYSTHHSEKLENSSIVFYSIHHFIPKQTENYPRNWLKSNLACGHFILHWQWILNNWDDNNNIKLLKNCYNALPAKGKAIIVDYILPEITDPDSLRDKLVFQLDLKMLTVLAVGARQRTEREIRQLALAAGFTQVHLIMEADSSSIIEMHKD